MPFTIHSVHTANDKRVFLNVARALYHNDTNWICPPDKMIHNTFEPGKNSYFNCGAAARWVLRDGDGNLCGRIAAFINEDKKMNAGIAVGGTGFFECVNDQQAANMLFDAARDWLVEHKAEAMDGPINFGENDRFWGLLVEGFTEPAFTTNYHHPYYQNLFTAYGFRDYYNMTTNVLYVDRPLDTRFDKIWDWIKDKNDIEFRHPDKSELDVYAQHFKDIYNEAWRLHETYKPITAERAMKFAKEIKLLFVKQMVPFAFVRNEPAAFIVCTPDLNQIFKPFNGRLNLFQLLQFLWRSRNNFEWYRRRGILTRGHAVAIGIKPKFQKYGLETGMIMSSLEAVKGMGFKSIELRWTGDFNPRIEKLHAALGAKMIHKHVTYRYLFDRNMEFKRYKTIPLGGTVD